MRPSRARQRNPGSRATRNERAESGDSVAAAIRRLGESAAAALNDPTSWMAMDYHEHWTRDPTDKGRWFATTPTVRRLNPRLLFELEKSEEWTAAVAAIKADDVLGRVADRLVGDAMGAGAIQSFALVTSGLEAWSMGVRRRDRLERVVAGWRFRYSQTHIDVVSLTIITGLSVAREIRLNPQVSIRPMRDSEISTAVAVGMIAPMPRFRGFAFLDTPACLAFRKRMRLRIGDDVEEGAAASYWRDLDLHEQAAVAALRLGGFGEIRVGPRIREHYGGGLSWSGLPLSNAYGGQRKLGGGAGRTVRGAFVRALTELRSDSAVAVALRRFSQSFEPRHEQDRFLDLWIAMESLFGSESATEVTFRLSLNAANSVRMPAATRRELFEWVLKCYGVRSMLVHGRRPSIRKLRRLTGEPAQSINELSDDLASIVRSAIRTRLIATRDPDWVELALRS